MKKLILLRHGKSSWEDMDINDYNRPLTERGKNNASDMGRFIFEKCGTPEFILSSSAKRARETAILAAAAMNYPEAEIKTEQELYLAEKHEIMKEIFRLPAHLNFCLMVGHNPGYTDLINYFGLKLDNLPTASAVCFEFDVDDWKEISWENARFSWIQLARNL